MGRLSGIETKRLVQTIEVVSDDDKRVLRFEITSTGLRISTREAHKSYWDTETFADLDKRDMSLLNTLTSGGNVYSDSTFEDLTNRTTRHQIEDPNPPVDEAERQRCSELDIERAKAANLAEQKELLRLELIRDHSLDKHVGASVEGCESCDRAIENAIRAGEAAARYNPATGWAADPQPAPAEDLPLTDPDELPF